MSQIRYRYNPELLSFYKIGKSFKDKFVRFLFFVGISIVATVILFFCYHMCFDSLKEIKLEIKNIQLTFQYKELNNLLDKLANDLEELQKRDDNIYRNFAGIDPIPKSIREAGFGGVEHYTELENFDNSEMVIEIAKKLDKIKKQVYVQTKSYDIVFDLVRSKEKFIACKPFIQPIAIKDFSRISDYFGWRVDHPVTHKPTQHNGIDYPGSIGTNVYSTGDGLVIITKISRYGYGNEIMIDHGFGYKTRYAHLDKILVDVGQEVKRGQLIGLLGKSGMTTGPHLHYEVRKNNQPVNSINFYYNDITSEEYNLMVKQISQHY